MGFVKEHKLLSGLIGALLAAVIGVAATGGKTTTPPITSNTIAPVTPVPAAPQSSITQRQGTPTYLSALSATGGDRPQRGDVQLAGKDLPNSIFYEHVENNNSQAAACESMSNCRATSYELGGNYSRFTATLGVKAEYSAHEAGHWWVLLDGKVIKQGTFVTNEAPEAIDLPISGGNSLELRASSEYATETTIVWGNAQVS